MNIENPSAHRTRLRVAFVAGTLGKGGAEKQLVYIVKALLQADVDVRVFSLTKGEFYESVLEESGCPVQWIGHFSNPVARIVSFVAALRVFSPHIVHASHFFANIYAVAAARVYGSISIGSIRSDGLYELRNNKTFGPYLLRAPSALISNSHFAPENLSKRGYATSPISVLPNVIDLAAFDANMAKAPARLRDVGEVVAIAITRLFPKKRIDLFLRALVLARSQMPCLRGVVVGDGAEMERLKSLAESSGLLPNGVMFVGHRDDVPAQLKHADMLVLPSDHEGFPNVILEAMAASLPIVTTPAGDAARIVEDGVDGYVVPYNDVELMAERIMLLAGSRDLRERFGRAGRQCVEERYGVDGLSDRLLSIYRATATHRGKVRSLGILSRYRLSAQLGEGGGSA